MRRGDDAQKENALVEAASDSPAAMHKLREKLRPLMEKIVLHYRGVRPEVPQEDRIEAAFKPLPTAVSHYLNARRAGQVTYKFSTYYTWWAKKQLEEELGIRPREES